VTLVGSGVCDADADCGDRTPRIKTNKTKQLTSQSEDLLCRAFIGHSPYLIMVNVKFLISALKIKNCQETMIFEFYVYVGSINVGILL